jgi:hypothetical protein
MRWRFDVSSHQNVWSRYMGSDLCDDDGNPVTETNPFDRTQNKRIIIDLSDAATKGCLLQLVREAWHDPEAHFSLGAAGWALMSGESRIADVVYPLPPSNDEAEAMVVAMEAAP